MFRNFVQKKSLIIPKFWRMADGQSKKSVVRTFAHLYLTQNLKTFFKSKRNTPEMTSSTFEKSICSINFNMGLVCNIWVECASFNGTAQRIQCTTLARGKVQHWPTSRIIFLHEHSLIHLQKRVAWKRIFTLLHTFHTPSWKLPCYILCSIYMTWTETTGTYV